MRQFSKIKIIEKNHDFYIIMPHKFCLLIWTSQNGNTLNSLKGILFGFGLTKLGQKNINFSHSMRFKEHMNQIPEL